MNIVLHPTQAKEIRESLGLSQSQLAKNTGINRAYISQFESGKRTLSDNDLTLMREEFVSHGIELPESTNVSVNGQDPELDIRQKDGFILPLDFDDELAENILNVLIHYNEDISNMLKTEIPAENLFGVKFDEPSEKKLHRLSPEVLEKMATCYLLVLKLRGDNSILDLLVDTDNNLSLGPNLHGSCKIINAEDLLFV